MYNPNDPEKFPVRKSPRLKGYDYSISNHYFVTVCTKYKKCIFGEPGNLNPCGKIAKQGILLMKEHNPDVRVETFVVMPNHVHILLFLYGGKARLEYVVGTWKAFVTREIHSVHPGMSVWQSSFYDHIVRNERSLQNIWKYIDNNPANWEKDCFYTNQL